MMQAEAARLIEAAKAGNQKALEILLQNIQPQIYRFGMKMCRHPQDAEDVLQDTLLALIHSFKTFRQDASFSTWLFTIVRSHCLKKRRKGKFDPENITSLDDELNHSRLTLQDPTPLPDEIVASRETRQSIESALKTLKPSYREVLILRDFEGFTLKEIAKILHIQVPTAKSRLHRARALLRHHLKPTQPKPGCPDIRLIFSQYLEGEVGPDICSAMQAHVQACPPCQVECDSLKRIVNLCQSAPQNPVPAQVTVKNLAALRTAIREAVT